MLLHKTCDDAAAGQMIQSNNIIGMHAVLYWRGSDDIIIIILLLMQIQTIIMHGFYVQSSSDI